MAGIFGFFDITKEGKGVRKDEPKKRGLFLFFELFFRKFWRFCKLNILYILASIPTFVIAFILSGVFTQNLIANAVKSAPGEFAQYAEMLDLALRYFFSLAVMVLWGMGPVTAGFTYVLRNYAREEHAWLWSDFWQRTKENFKQSIVVWIIDQVVLVLLCVAYIFYSSQSSWLQMVKYVIVWVAIIYTAMHLYMYTMMVTFKLKLKDIYRNSFLMAIAKLPVNLVAMAAVLLINIGIPFFGIIGFGGGVSPLYWAIFFALEFFVFISLSGFITTFVSYRALEKVMIKPEEPEKPSDAADFSDEMLIKTEVE